MDASQSTVLAVLAHALVQNGQPGRAATLLEALDVLEPGKPATLRSLAVAQIRAGKPDKALRTLDRLAMAGAGDDCFHLLRAEALVALSRPLEASMAMNAFVQMRARGSAAGSAP